MEEKEIKEEGICGGKCKVTKNHIICILSVLLVIATVSAISLAFCTERGGFRDFHRKEMMEGKYENEGGRNMRGERDSLLKGENVIPTSENSPSQPKRSPDVITPTGSPVDIVPTNPTVTQ